VVINGTIVLALGMVIVAAGGLFFTEGIMIYLCMTVGVGILMDMLRTCMSRLGVLLGSISS
jgi:hypothetical protein